MTIFSAIVSILAALFAAKILLKKEIARGAFFGVISLTGALYVISQQATEPLASYANMATLIVTISLVAAFTLAAIIPKVDG